MSAASSSSRRPLLSIALHDQDPAPDANGGLYGYNGIRSDEIPQFCQDMKDLPADQRTWRHRGGIIPNLPFKTALMTQPQTLSAAIDNLDPNEAVDSGLFDSLKVTDSHTIEIPPYNLTNESGGRGHCSQMGIRIVRRIQEQTTSLHGPNVQHGSRRSSSSFASGFRWARKVSRGAT